MKKILFLILFVLTANIAFAGSLLDFDEHDMSCTKNGVGKFNFFFKQGEGEIDLQETKVFADEKEIKGEWMNFKEKEINTIKRGERAFFVSDIAEFKEEKIYDMEIKYVDTDETEKNLDFQMSCPGFEFACEIFEMEMNKCYNKEGKVFIELEGGGFEQNNYKVLFEELEFFLKGNMKRHEGSISGMNPKASGSNRNHIIEIPLGYPITYAYIRGKPYGCDRTIDSLDTIAYKKCTTLAEKTEPSDNTEQISEEKDNEKQENKTEQPEEKKESFFGKIWRFITSIF